MTPFLETLWAAVSPAILEVLSAIVMLSITLVAQRLHKAYGLTIEQRHREALHTAIVSGVRAAMARGDKDAARSAVEHALASTPDAVKALGASDGVLYGIAQAKLSIERLR